MWFFSHGRAACHWWYEFLTHCQLTNFLDIIIYCIAACKRVMQICLIPEIILYCEGVAFKFDRLLPPLDSKDKEKNQKSYMRKVGARVEAKKFELIWCCQTYKKKEEERGWIILWIYICLYPLVSKCIWQRVFIWEPLFTFKKWKFHFLVCLVSRGLLTRHMGFLTGKKKPPLGPGGPNIGIYDLFIHHGPKLNH